MTGVAQSGGGPARYSDPFGDDIVTSPRRIETAVESLNRTALRELIYTFERLALRPAPRLGRDQPIQLVLSPEPGYGKSHLLGRLFHALGESATLLYLRPFQDPRSCWVSLLDKVVVALDHAELAHAQNARSGEPSQLDTLVRRVLLGVMQRLLSDERVQLPKKRAASRLFQKYPQTVLETPGFREWLQHYRGTVLAAAERLLSEHGIELAAQRLPWLKVLIAYAYSEEEPALRQLCLDWMTFRPLDPDEGRLLGLRRAELPDADLPYEQRNEMCFERLADLFALGAFYRPFVLCFDQTELYGSNAPLARSFGQLLSRLRREVCNHFTVVTANSAVWQARVFTHFEIADQHAFAVQPVELEGMGKEHASELLSNRLRQAGLSAREGFVERLVNQLFAEHERRSVREVLRRARRVWDPEAQLESADTLFEKHRRRLMQRSGQLEFDPGVLQWSLEHVLGPALGAQVETVLSPKGYFAAQWTLGQGRREIFGFEGGSHWRRWAAIIREAHVYHQDAEPGELVRATLFRFPAQPPLPARTQEALAGNRSVRVIELSTEQVADLYAAHDLMADVQQGNTELPAAELSQFLQQRLQGLARVIDSAAGAELGDSCAGPEAVDSTVELSHQVAAIVERKRFVTLALLRGQLPAGLESCSDDELVAAARQVSAIKIHVAPGSKVLQWLR